MKTLTNQSSKPMNKGLVYAILLLFIFTLGSFRSVACVASFTYNAGVNGHYTFTSTSIGLGSNPHYSWNAGDGSGWQMGGSAFNHIYVTNNTFNVILAIYDSTNNCMDTTAAIPVTVSNVTNPCLLSAGFSASVGAYGVVTFTSTSTHTNANTLYYWVPGDSNQRIQGGTTFVHQYPFRNMYSAWLIIEDTGSAYCIDSVQEYVNVTTSDSEYCHMHANFTYSVGANGNVTFTNTSLGTNPGDYYNLYPGDTTNTLGNYTGNFNHTYLFDGTYNVDFYINGDSNYCNDSITLPVTVTGACNLEANFTYAYDSNGGVKFTSNSVGTNVGTIYKWTFGDGSPTANGDDTITHGYPFIGYYTVTLVDSNLSGCTATITKTIYVQNRDSLHADFTYMSDSINQLQIDFTSTSLGTNSNTYYKWTPGDGDPSDSGIGMNTYQHIYYSYGPYAATLTIWYTVLPKIKTHSSSPGRYDESSYTAIVNVVPTAVSQVNESSAVYKVYPNPNNGLFRIAVTGLANEKNAEIRISNMIGQVIYQNTAALANGQITTGVNLPDSKDGIYLLQVITPGNTYTSRIAVQK